MNTTIELGPRQERPFDRAQKLMYQIKALVELREEGDRAALLKPLDDFAQKLAKTYPDDYERYSTYHALVGSALPDDHATPERRMPTMEDFPGEYCVVDFLEGYRRQLLSPG